MPLTTINAAKDLELTYQPLLFVTITARDGHILRLCTHGANTSEGGATYGGNSYQGRLMENNLGAIQGHHEGGIDVVSRVALTAIDNDKSIYLNSEQAHGLKGASISIDFALLDVVAGTYSSDSIRKFYGICEQPSADADFFYITATSVLSLQRKLLPSTPLQRRCPWVNPTTSGERTAASSEDSIFYRCGETRDVGTAPPCSYTKATCTQPNRRGGLEWEAESGGRGRNYLSGQWMDFQNNPNEQKWGRPIPLVYGTAWVDAITSVVGDGNATRGEAIVCDGEADAILEVVVNDIRLQAATDITGGTNYLVQDALARYNVINRGDRDGAPNQDKPWNGEGDSYGSMCTILWVLHNKYADPASVPRVRVLVRGPKIRVYSDASTYASEYSDNPVWVVVDLLLRAGVRASALDMASAITAAAVCSASISYTDQYGASANHARFACSLVVAQKQTAADLIRRVRLGCGLRLVQNSSTGQVQFFMDGTLAVQQGSAPAGTNNATPITSKSASGGAANGYLAYDFTRVLDVNGKSSLKISGPSGGDAPNRVSLSFSNSERNWAGDSLAMIDAAAIAAAGKQIDATFDAAGINTMDQAKRIARRWLAEQNRGNTRNDTAGTEIYQFLYSFGAVRVRAGHICRLTDSEYGISNQLIRILQLRPSRNYETVEITAAAHNDDWYVDTYGQEDDPENGLQLRNRLARPAYPWCPRKVQPAADDPLFGATDWTFNLAEDHETAADGTSLARLIVTGALPVNTFAPLQAPVVARQGTTASSGGTIAGGGWVYYHAACAVDADGLLSPPSLLCETVVTAVGSANTVTMGVTQWPDGTVGYVTYGGRSPNRLTKQTATSGTPSSITFTAYNECDRGMPDSEFDRLLFRVKRMVHSGVFGIQVTGVTSTTITVTDSAWTVNQWAGYDCSILAKNNGIGDLPFLNFRVSSNTADTLTLAQNPAAAGVGVGDVIVMRSKPTVGSDAGGNFLSDANWVNSYAASGLTVDAEVGNVLRIISGLGRGDTYRIASNTATQVYIDGDWIHTPNGDSRYVIEEPDWKVLQYSDTITNSDQDAELNFSVGVENYERSTLLVQVLGVDGGGNESIEGISPIREIYVFGSTGDVLNEDTEVSPAHY